MNARNFMKRILFLLLITADIGMAQVNENQEILFQSERKIPVAAKVDVLVVGGTVAAVSAAISAAEKGIKVFLVESKTYLGEDLCATLCLKRNAVYPEKHKLEKLIFGDSDQTNPMRVKGTLSQALIDAGVQFVYGSFVTDIIWNEDNKPAGVIIANRAGRQAIVAKTIIDASMHAVVCKTAEAGFKPFENDSLHFERIIVLPGEYEEKPVYRKQKLKLPMPDLSFESFARAEQLAREKTYTEGQLRSSESLIYYPPNPVLCIKNPEEWDTSSDKTGHFQPEGFSNLFVLSGHAAIPDHVKESILKPGAMAYFGEEIGEKAADLAAGLNPSKDLAIRSIKTTKKSGDVKEVLQGLRPVTKMPYTTVKSPKTGIPVLGEYDVVVIGGGTSGAPSAISAARMGMKVLVVEYLEGLGGLGTLGLIGKPYHGRKVGFAAEVPFPSGNIEPKMEWYRKELDKAGAEIWLGVIGCGAYLEKNKVTGAIVATPLGRGVVKAKIVIDATGNADVAVAAGAEYRYGDIEKESLALQGTGFSSRPLTGNYYNSDYLLVDEADMLDIWRALVSVHITKNTENQFDAVPVVQNRERRRIVGDFTLSYLDQIAGRTYPDAIVYSASDYDSHGYPSSPYFALLPHDEVSKKKNHPAPGGSCYTPFRCLLPKGLNGMLVTGLGISMDRDAAAMVRMQFDMANQGYAAGLAASLAIVSNVSLREIDIKELQRRLIEKGILTEDVLEMKDNYPYSKKVIQLAIDEYGEAKNPEIAGVPLAIILSHRETAIPMVKETYINSSGKSSLLYAKLLGMCGENAGNETLINELRKYEQWSERILQGSMADFAHLPTPEDGLVLALGFSGDKSVLPELLKMVGKLDASIPLSHHRSLAMALEKIGDESAAEPLAKLLQKPEMSGHAVSDIEDALVGMANDGKGAQTTGSLQKRSRAIREITLARALYNCGDYNKTGEKILKAYLNDMRGLFARHAFLVLNKTGR
jgi:ribulose 1,5-bisphosphate synthetase/thiazole synthase